MVLPVPLPRRSGDAGLPGPGRHVAAGRLLPGLVGSARAAAARWAWARSSSCGQVTPNVKLVSWRIDLKRVIIRKLVMGVGDGVMEADGQAYLRGAATCASACSTPRAWADRGNVMRRVADHRYGDHLLDRHQRRGGRRPRCARPAPGIVAAPEYAELGFRCQVHAPSVVDWEALVDRRAARFLAAGTAYAHLAMEQAIADSGLDEADVSNERTGLIVGSGGASTRTHRRGGADRAREGPQAHRPVRGAQGDELGPVGDALHLVRRSRGSTIRSPRPARPRPTASARPPSRSSWASRT